MTHNTHHLIIGGSGFIGRHLAAHLIHDGHSVTIMTRNKQRAQAIFAKLDTPPNIIESYDELDDDQFPQQVICLAGAGIADKRWSMSRKATLIKSRTQPLQTLKAALEHRQQTIDRLLIGSAIGYYGYGETPDAQLTESSQHYDDFAHHVCQSIEQQSTHLQHLTQQIVQLRTGVVLGSHGGALAKMILPAKCCLNGKIGHGQQWFSWIHIHDWIAATQHILQHPSPATVYNLCAPTPVRNHELSAALGKTLGRPWQLPIPQLSLTLLLGEAAILLTGSQKVHPQQLLQEKFSFRYANIQNALTDILSQT